MQDELSRLSQKSYTLVQSRQTDVLSDMREHVVNGLILYPKARAVDLVEVLIQEADSATGELEGVTLRRRFYLSAIRSERRKQGAVQLRLPGFEHLPHEIPVKNGAPVALLDANYRRIREFYWSLKADSLREIPNRPKIKEAKGLMDKMQKHARTERGITVRQVLLLEGDSR